MITRNIKLSIAILSMLISLTTYAQGPRGGGQGGRGGRQGGPSKDKKPDASEILKLLDTNDDDKIDKEEASKDKRGKIAEDFDLIDLDENGFIDIEELKTELNLKGPRKVSAKKLLKQVDQDEDGLLNELEVAAKDKRDLMTHFSVIDTDQNSQLDLEELKAFYAKDDKEKKNRKMKIKN